MSSLLALCTTRLSSHVFPFCTKRNISYKKPIDLSLSLVTKRVGINEQSLFIEIVLRAVKGGVTTVVLDDVNADLQSCLTSAHYLKKMLPDKVQLVVKRHFSIATLAKTGVQLSGSKASIQSVRPYFQKQILGMTAKTKIDVFDAQWHLIDYLAIPLPIWGIEGLKWARSVSSLPILAEGPIHLNNLNEVCEALDLKKDGVGVTDALWESKDPIVTAQEMRAIIQKVKASQSKKC